MKNIFILITFIIMLSSCESTDAISKTISEKPVNIITAKKQSQTIYSNYRGFVVAKDVKKLSFEQAGKVKSILVDKGQQISTGDKLAVLDTEYTQMALDSAKQNTVLSEKGTEQLQTNIDRIKLGLESEKINLEKALLSLDAEKINLSKSLTAIDAEKLNLDKLKTSYENQLNTLQINYDDTLDKYNKLKVLYQNNVVSNTDYTNAKLALDTVSSNLETLKSNYANDILLQNKNIELMEQNYELQKINIQTKNIDLQKIKIQDLEKQLEGLNAQADSQTAQTIQSEIGVQKYEKQLNDGVLTSPINGFVLDILAQSGEETGAGHPVVIIKSDNQVINFGIPVEDYKNIYLGMILNLESSDITFSGKITSIGQYPDENTMTYEIEITPEKQDLLHGTIVNINIPISETQSILLPLSSIVIVDGVNYVYVVDNFIAHKKEVLLGSPIENKVICTNLEEGQQVITAGTKFIKEGDKVQVIEELSNEK